MYFVLSTAKIEGGPFVNKANAFSKLYQLLADTVNVPEKEFLSMIHTKKGAFEVNGFSIVLSENLGSAIAKGSITRYFIFQYQSLAKEELEKYLADGYTLDDLIPDTSKGEDCIIYKGTWEKSDRIIYIPDYGFNHVISSRKLYGHEIKNVSDCCYSGNDFLRLCKGYENVAQALFGLCNWQHPDIQDLFDAYESEEDFLADFGITMDKLEERI